MGEGKLAARSLGDGILLRLSLETLCLNAGGTGGIWARLSLPIEAMICSISRPVTVLLLLRGLVGGCELDQLASPPGGPSSPSLAIDGVLKCCKVSRPAAEAGRSGMSSGTWVG